MSKFGAMILSRLSANYEAIGEWKPISVAEASEVLQETFPSISQQVSERVVVDFGSGLGQFSLALAQWGTAQVYGVEIQVDYLHRSRELAKANGLDKKVSFLAELPESIMRAGVDLVISHDSFEHFDDPLAILLQMRRLLNKKSGRILLAYGPPWYSPFGAHMHFFTRLPWVHLLFSEHSIFKVRAQYRADGVTRYRDVPGGLNQMSLAKFEKLVQESGLEFVFCRYRCVKGLNFLAYLPLVRELFVNQVICELKCKS